MGSRIEPRRLVAGKHGEHRIFEADSRQVRYKPTFDLVLTSPPFFNPRRRDSKYGTTLATRDLGSYVQYVADILLNAAGGLRERKLLCFVKTDVNYKGALIPVGYRIAEECARHGLPLRAHWIWRRFGHYSPYSPSFANIFVLGLGNNAPRFDGIILDAPWRHNKQRPPAFTPEVFAVLIEVLSQPGDMVLDPFVGAGSVVLAAARTRRWAVGIEISRSQIWHAKQQLLQTPNVSYFTMRTQ